MVRVGTVLVMLIVYQLVDRMLARKLSNHTNNAWQTNCLKAPMVLIVSLVMMWLVGLSWEDIVFGLGDIRTGVKLILLLAVPFSVVSSALIFLIPKEQLQQQRYGVAEYDGWQLLYVWLLVGPVEEVIYRGFVQTALNNVLPGSIWKLQYSTIIAAVLFVAVHYLNVLNKSESRAVFLTQLPGRLLLALVLGYMLQQSGSLIYPILAHNLQDGLNISFLNLRMRRISKTIEPAA